MSYSTKTFLEWTVPRTKEMYSKDGKLEKLAKHRLSIGKRVFLAVVEFEDSEEGETKRKIGYLEYIPETGEMKAVVENCEPGVIENFR